MVKEIPAGEPNRIIARATANEPEITALLIAAALTGGASLERLETRIKSVKSVEGKLNRTAARNLERGLPVGHIEDAIRYTCVLADHAYWSGGNRVLQALTESGARVVADPRGWRRRGYRGRHVILESESGQLLEVQLHTVASLDAAERAHVVFEQERAPGIGSAQRKRLKRLQHAIFDAVPWPDRVPEL